MFGWEFPPHIAGGLGTACYGMTRGLARNGVDVTFIVPHAYGDEDQRFTHVVNASDVGGLVRFDGQRRGRHSGEDVVHPHRLEHGPLYLPRGVRVLPRAVRQVGAEDLVDDRCLETALHLLGQVRRQPHGGGGALRRGRRAGGQGPRRTVRRDPRPRLAHLLRGHRRQTRLREAAGGAHARHGVRPLGRERQHAGLRHRAGRHARRRPRDRRFEPHAQHRHQPLRRSRRKRSSRCTTPCASPRTAARFPSGASPTRS